VRVGIVNDSVLVREALRRIVEGHGGHRVVWQAGDGLEAQVCVLRECPDLILMDLFMPLCDGVEATRAIMASRPCPILVVTASVDAHVDRVFEAMGAGALDAIDTPLLDDHYERREVETLLRKMDVVARLGWMRLGTPFEAGTVEEGRCCALPPLLALGASAGGPAALASILARLPADLPAALIVVQHVDAGFAPGLVRWLAEQTRLPVHLAEEGVAPCPGHVYLAPGGAHLLLDAGGCLRVADAAPDQPSPSVDRFLRSLLPHADQVAAAGLLTGMGRDGAAGLLALRHCGVATFVQDQATATVYGMPKAALELGAANDVLPLPAIAEFLVERARRHHPHPLEART